MATTFITTDSSSSVVGTFDADFFFLSSTGSSSFAFVNLVTGSGEDTIGGVPSGFDNISLVINATDFDEGDRIRVAYTAGYVDSLTSIGSASDMIANTIGYRDNTISGVGDNISFSDVSGTYKFLVNVPNSANMDEFAINQFATTSYVTEVIYIGPNDGTTVNLGTSSERFLGTARGETVLAGEGDDTVYGYSGYDVLSGGTGNDILYGNIGLDFIYGGDGADTLFGGQNGGSLSTGESTVSAYRDGVETVSGGAGDDLLYGNHGTDLLVGGEGADTIYGGQDSDTLSGGAGSDVLVGNMGGDVLVGGSGNDLFSISLGNDTVSDFDGAGGDLISGGTRVSIVDVGSDALVTFSSGATVTLTGVSAASLADAYFL